jgi:diguanylate cyclase (GGDEF)-like protein/PAS domain S-box-containing protein
LTAWFRQLLTAPEYPGDPERTAIGRLFHIAALVLLAASVVATVNNLLVGEFRVTLIMIAAIALMCSLIVAARHGYLRLASAVLPTVMLLTFLAGPVIRDGVHDSASVAIAATMMMAGILLPWPSLLPFIALAVGGFFAMGYGEIAGFLHTRFAGFTDFRFLLGVSISFVFVAVIARVLTNTMIGKLREARSHGADAFRARERLELAMQSSRASLWEWDIERGTMYFDQGWTEMLGFDAGEKVTTVQQLEGMIHQDDLHALVIAQIACMKGDTADYAHEFRVRNKSGEWVWVLNRGRVVERGAGGRALGMAGIVMDVTERRNAESRMRQSQERFSRMFQATPAATTITRSEDGTFLEANEAALQLFGREREQVIGQSALSLGLWPDPRDRVRLVSALEKEHGVNLQPVTIRRPTGELRHILVSAAWIELDAQRQMLMSAVDITENRRAEELLRQSEERFAKIFQASPDAIVISRLADGTYLEVNQSWLDLFGYAREELIGRSSLDLGVWADPADRGRFVEQIRERAALRDFETRFRKKSGAIIDALISAEVIDIAGESHIIVPILDITDRKRAEERIQQLATRDPLTGLPNRLLLDDRLALSISSAQRQGGYVALLFIDLDRFKVINDSLGHAIGDAFLKAVAERLSGVVRRGDTLARLGGDEFVVLLENIHAMEDAAGQVARKILGAMTEPFAVDGHTLSCSCSVGISVFPSDTTDPQMLMRDADTAMYHAKEAGRGSYRYFSQEMNARMQDRLQLEIGLREAVAGGQFELAYQPKVSISSGAITGFEALLRWRHPAWGLVPPERFIEVAEETGLVVDIGRWVMGEACRQLREWRDRGLPLHPVAVNLSVRQFNPGLVEEIGSSLAACGADPGLIELEITESLFMQDPAKLDSIFAGLARLGIRVTIDDFGTGYSSLGYIRKFAVDGLKIDRSFVSDVASVSQNVAIVRAVITMCRGLGIRVIAEGVETREQLEVLEKLDCDEYQGYLFSRPVSAGEIEQTYLKTALSSPL